MWDDLVFALEDLTTHDRDDLIDDLQELDLGEICKHLWLLELVIAICNSRGES